MENIVILGAGFGGLKAAMTLCRKAKWLSKRGYRVILIDRNSYHTYTPVLYEVATTSKETANYLDLKEVATYPIEPLFKEGSVQFIQDAVSDIDARKGKISLEREGEIPYSHLIFALGAKNHFFNIENLEKNCFTLKSFTAALALRDAILEKVYSAKHNQELNVVICGAGATGVELAAELQEWFAELKKEGTRCNLKTTLIDSASRVFSKLDKDVSEKAKRRLKKLGTNMLTKSLVEKVTKDRVILKGDVRIRYDILVWTGGIQANDLIDNLPFKKTHRGVEVDKTLKAKLANKRTKLKGEVYIIGDSAISKAPSFKGLVPQMARPAITGGHIAAKNILRSISGKDSVYFNPIAYPYVSPVGGKYAVLKIGKVLVSGIFGWILKGLIELNYLLSIMPAKMAFKVWWKGLKIFLQNDRLG